MDIAVHAPGAVLARPAVARIRVALVVGAGAGLTAGAAALGASAGSGAPGADAVLRAAMVGVPLMAAGIAARTPPYERMARILALTGVVAFGTTLAESDASLPYSVGRACGWLLEAVLVWTVLAFPTGRLAAPIDRALTKAMAAVIGLFASTLLLAPDFVVPSPYTSCTADCPANAFAVAGDDAAVVIDVLRPLAGLATFLVLCAVVARLAARMRDATPLTRQLLAPLLTVGMLRTGLVGIAIAGRDLGNGRDLAEAASWLIAIATPVVALAFLVSILRWRLLDGRALRGLASCVQTLPDAATLRRGLADALGDPTTEIVFPVPGRQTPEWRDSAGRRVAAPGRAPGRRAHRVTGRSGVIAVLVHDAALAARPELIDAASGLAAMALENQRLIAAAEVATQEARASRARIAAGADAERRRIERDLHDGAQQRLVALRIELGLAEELAVRDPEGCAARLHELERSVDEALDELRALAHGVCPPLLTDRGLADALRAATRHVPLRTRIDVHGVTRYSPEVETAVYFCVLEALQNATKHARGARSVVVELDGRSAGQLRFTVRDDGAGTDTDSLQRGAGITNMHDRVAALGGELRLTSRPNVGTEVRGHVPAATRVAA